MTQMKTIKQIADELNTTPQNIYNHLKRNNVSRASLKHKKQGKQVFYDEDAETLIKSLIQEPVKQDKQNNENDETFETLNAENKRLNDELKEAREAAAAAQEEITRLRQVEEELRHQITGLIDAERNRTELAKFEAAKKANLLQAPAGETVGFFQRVKFLFKGNKVSE